MEWEKNVMRDMEKYIKDVSSIVDLTATDLMILEKKLIRKITTLERSKNKHTVSLMTVLLLRSHIIKRLITDQIKEIDQIILDKNHLSNSAKITKDIFRINVLEQLNQSGLFKGLKDDNETNA